VGVVVPARNEEALLTRCFASIELAVAFSGLGRDCIHVVAVADACTDRTASLAARILEGWGEVLEVDRGSVGYARRVGVRRVLERFGTVRPVQIWLANTDADSEVSPTWLSRQLELAEQGATAIAGVVSVGSFAEHSDITRRRYERRYQGPSDEHRHIHGANFGVRADAYLAAGGWPAIELAEDEALWQTLRWQGWKTLSTRTLAVTTSGRQKGRVPGGFAALLTSLGQDA
jgi:glycosyltransferase involved in cell wall biosynthesis